MDPKLLQRSVTKARTQALNQLREAAAPTHQRGFGFHPLCAFVDHGGVGTGEMVAVALHPGNAGSNTTVDHIPGTRAALAQLPDHQPGRWPGKKVLIRTNGAGSSNPPVPGLAHDPAVVLLGRVRLTRQHR